MQIQYLSQNNNGTYTYRRRTPNALQTILNKETIKVSLGRELSLAISKTNQFTQAIQQSIQVLQMQILENDKKDLISNLLKPIGYKVVKEQATKPLWELICNDYLKSTMNQTKALNILSMIIFIFGSVFIVVAKRFQYIEYRDKNE